MKVDLKKSITNLYKSLIAQKDIDNERAVILTAEIYALARVNDIKKRYGIDEPQNIKTTTPANKSSLN